MRTSTTNPDYYNQQFLHTRGASVLFFFPLFIDSAALFVYIATKSVFLYQAVVFTFDLIALAGALLVFARGKQILQQAYGPAIWAPALIYGVTLLINLLGGSGNHAYILAALRYVVWVIFVTGILARGRNSSLSRAQISSMPTQVLPSTRRSFFARVAMVISLLALIQLIVSDFISTWLYEIHSAVTPANSTNAVMTSVVLGKSFGSLTLRNPIELGYIGLALLCTALAARRSRTLVLFSLVLVIAGRSNVSVIAAILVIIVNSVLGGQWRSGLQFMLLLTALALLLCFLIYLPDIYLGSGSTWDDMFITLSEQRLGMLNAMPNIFDLRGASILITGSEVPLTQWVDEMFQAGFLPEIFAEGGAIAVFDVMWFGLLVIGGVPFVLGAACLVACGLQNEKRIGLTVESRALRLYTIVVIVSSFSSQILLSRYGLYFLSYFLAAAALASSDTYSRYKAPNYGTFYPRFTG